MANSSIMPRLIRIDTEDDIGTISDLQLEFLVEQLEDDHEDDHDYFIDRETLELMSDNGADPELLAMLEKAIGDDDEMRIAWADGGAPARPLAGG